MGVRVEDYRDISYLFLEFFSVHVSTAGLT